VPLWGVEHVPAAYTLEGLNRALPGCCFSASSAALGQASALSALQEAAAPAVGPPSRLADPACLVAAGCLQDRQLHSSSRGSAVNAGELSGEELLWIKYSSSRQHRPTV
jgi:hypothetical protein